MRERLVSSSGHYSPRPGWGRVSPWIRSVWIQSLCLLCHTRSDESESSKLELFFSYSKFVWLYFCIMLALKTNDTEILLISSELRFPRVLPTWSNLSNSWGFYRHLSWILNLKLKAHSCLESLYSTICDIWGMYNMFNDVLKNEVCATSFRRL